MNSRLRTASTTRCASSSKRIPTKCSKSGANYQEMFRKVKTELVRKYKAVL